MALSLLRYLSTEKLDIPSPLALLLWSPSINLEAGMDPFVTDHSAHYATDYLTGNFQTWGATSFTKGLELTDSKLRPYVVQLGYPFRSTSPIWICVGESEILGPDGLQMGEMLRHHGNTVKFHIIPDAPHDVMFVGKIMGFEKEAVEATKTAHEFIEDLAEDMEGKNDKAELRSISQPETCQPPNGRM